MVEARRPSSEPELRSNAEGRRYRSGSVCSKTHPGCARSPPLILAGPRGLDKHAPHDPGRHGQEMCPVLPVHAPHVDEPQVSLVEERCRLEAVVVFFPAHAPTCNLPQLVVYAWNDLLERAVVARAPRQE